MRTGWLAILIFLFPINVTAAEECEWMPVTQVAEALPDYGPWQTMRGGQVGSCQFLGRSRGGPAVLAFNQMVKDSASQAQDFVVSMRTNLGPGQVVEDLDGLGSKGFGYRPKESTAGGARNSLFLVGHQGRVVVMGSLTVPGEVSTDTRAAYLALAGNALGLSADEGAMAAATQCRYFNQSVLERFFEGASFSQQVYGSNSCIASAGKRVLMLAIVENVNPDLAKTMAGNGDCTLEPIPALGAQGSISYACAEGNPRAAVRYLQGSEHFELSWIPGREPSEAERDLLVKLALAAREGVQ